MNSRRILGFSKRVLKQFRHDKRTMAFILIMPLVLIIVFGYTFGGDVEDVHVIVVNQDEEASLIVPDPFSGNITEIRLTIGDYIEEDLDTDTLEIENGDDYEAAKKEVKESQFFDKTWAAIYIPKEFTSTFSSYIARKVVSMSIMDETNCTMLGYFWYNGVCHSTDRSAASDHYKKSDCEDAGFMWYNNKCHENFEDKVRWTETECGARGYFWYDNRCHDGADLTIVSDGSNPNVDAAIHIVVLEAILKAQKRIIAQNPELQRFDVEVPIAQVDDYAYGNGDIEFIDSFAPAIMAFAMMMVTTMITIFIFIQERKHGTLDRLLASPATETEIVVGYVIAFVLVSVIQAMVILLAAIGLFGIYIAPPVLPNVLTAFMFLILLGMGHQCLGIMLSSWAKNELQAIQFVPLIVFPAVLLCGLFWPIEAIPEFLRPLSYIIPLTYAIDAVRSTMTKGLGVGALCCHGFALIVFAIVMVLGAILFLKKRK
jgi:ABC transporter DrrB family efflux protein